MPAIFFLFFSPSFRSSKKTVTTQKVALGAPSLRTAKYEETRVTNTSTHGTSTLGKPDVRNTQSSSTTSFSVSGPTKQVQNINTKLRNIDLKQPESNTYVSRQVETYPKQTVSKTVTVQKSKPGAQANVQSVTRVTKRTETSTTTSGTGGSIAFETPSLRKVNISSRSKNLDDFTPSLRAGFQDKDTPSLRKQVNVNDNNLNVNSRNRSPSPVLLEKPDTSTALESRPEDRVPEDTPEEFGTPVEDNPAV